MLLAIDIGNTNITVGLFKQEEGKYLKGPFKQWRLSTNKLRTADEYGSKLLDLFHYSLLEAASVTGVAVASVVPALDGTFEEMSLEYFKKKAFFVNSRTAPFIQNRYDKPSDVGADRLCDAAAVFELFGGPAVVIDFGTATTFDCIGKKGEYLGGVIAPGPGTSAEALAEKTSKLPKVEISNPGKAIADNTVGSIQAGLYYGYIGLIKEILARVKKEMPGSPYVVATGGLAGLIAPEIKEIRTIVPELTLEGIRIIWSKRQKQNRNGG